MYFKFNTLFDKIWAIFICLIFFLGFYINFPLIIFTEADHIKCQNNGYCKYYTTFINQKHRNLVEFNLNNTDSFVCKPYISSKKNDAYQLILINSKFEESIITKRRGGYKHCKELKFTLDNYDKNGNLNYTYYANMYNSPWYLWLCWIFGLLFTPWLIYSTVISFIKNDEISSYFDLKH